MTFYSFCRDEHNNAIVDTVVSLMDRGYKCYLEFEIFKSSDLKDRHRFVVDILACRGTETILIEVGTLSQNYYEDRFAKLKQLMPRAKIWHVTQWKNWITSFDWQRVNEEERWRLYRFHHCDQQDIEDVFGKW